MSKHKKPAMSFRLGESYRDKLEAVASWRDEPQVEVLRRMITVAFRDMEKKKKQRAESRSKRL